MIWSLGPDGKMYAEKKIGRICHWVIIIIISNKRLRNNNENRHYKNITQIKVSVTNKSATPVANNTPCKFTNLYNIYRRKVGQPAPTTVFFFFFFPVKRDDPPSWRYTKKSSEITRNGRNYNLQQPKSRIFKNVCARASLFAFSWSLYIIWSQTAYIILRTPYVYRNLINLRVAR